MVLVVARRGTEIANTRAGGSGAARPRTGLSDATRILIFSEEIQSYQASNVNVHVRGRTRSALVFICIWHMKTRFSVLFCRGLYFAATTR